MVKRAVLPVVVSTLVISSCLVIWFFRSSIQAGHLPLVGLIALYVTPFVSAGFLLLIPTIWLIRRISMPIVTGLGLLIAAGAALGTLLTLPFANVFGLGVGTVAGSFSATVWAFLNRDYLVSAGARPI